MQMLISQQFVWHGIKKDVTAWVRYCTHQLAKVHHHTIAPLHKFILPKSRFDCIHIDIADPLSQSHGDNYFSLLSTGSLAGQKPFQWSASL